MKLVKMNLLICAFWSYILLPFVVIQATETVADEVTMSADVPSYDYYDPQNSEEAYREYNNFQNSFVRQYTEIEAEDHLPTTTMATNVDDDDESVAITVPGVGTTELPLTMAEHSSIDSNESINNKTTTRDTNGTQSQPKPVESIAMETDDEPVFHRSIVNDENAIHKVLPAAISYNRNESFNNSDDYYVNDDVGPNDGNTGVTEITDDTGNANANQPQQITTQYLEDMTSLPIASPSIFQTTRSPPLPATYTTSAATASPVTVSNSNSNGIFGNGRKVAKKIDAPTRVYKYNADEILRKYLDDTYIRSPMASLISTSPAALRKAKILWKSSLRANTPIDFVLLSFNSSGKNF